MLHWAIMAGPWHDQLGCGSALSVDARICSGAGRNHPTVGDDEPRTLNEADTAKHTSFRSSSF
jgi:hypothetical protein